MISRRNFFNRIVQGLGLSLVLPAVEACKTPASIKGQITGPNAVLGHRLRTLNFPSPIETLTLNTLIVGGGVAGLSAARYLKKFTDDFQLLELEDKVGGNAMGGSNSISSFPWGAHYLPLPGNNDTELISFLKETNVITGIRNDLPVYNEYYLCHDPKERLFINHFWQEGLIPHEGLPTKDRQEIDRFLSMMHAYKLLKGNDQRDAFAIPLAYCSADENIRALDKITALQFLNEHQFTSPYLHWYVNYCCADDYGSTIQETSAWAMVHYFASRKGNAANAAAEAVLTWPEGNYWLINELKKGVDTHIQTNMLAYQVTLNNNGVEVLVFDAARNISKKIIAQSLILATPQFINQRLLKNTTRPIDYAPFDYAPWIVANINIDAALNERKGEQLCWDNVIYGSEALGYVNALQQRLGFHDNLRVLTYYKPITGSGSTARKGAYIKTFEQWKTEILSDLRVAHPDIEESIREMNVWLWGHGMIKPTPDFIWSKNRINASASIDHKIYFAHSDLSGISIFEEAFYHGHRSAKAVLGHDKN